MTDEEFHSPFTVSDCPCRVFTDEEEQTAWHAGFEAAMPDVKRLAEALYQAQSPPWSKGSVQERHYRNEMMELARATLKRLSEQREPPGEAST